MELLRSVQTCKDLRMDEQQSILVKCSAISPEVKMFIEKGDGKKMFSSAGRQHQEQMKANEMPISSIFSLKKLNDELQDIISNQIPENTAAIAHARSYGDLRENAEYKAAKERQAFLLRRRSELEENILTTQAVDFSHISPDNVAIPGSKITILYNDSGQEETFYLLGIWDSDPEKNYLSCASRLGEEINQKVIGDSIALPNGKKATLTKIEKLPKKLLKLLAGE